MKLDVSEYSPFGLTRGVTVASALLSLCILSTTCLAIERRPGSIKTSDGVELKGEVWFNNAELKIYEGEDASGGRYVKMSQEEVIGILFKVKSSSMEKPWRFKTAGSDEKEYLDGEYPLVDLSSEVKLKSGQVLKGHLMTAPVFVRIEDREHPGDWDTKKFVLKYQYKGEVGQKMKDLAYVTAISFESDGSTSSAGSMKGVVTGTVKDMGKIQQAAAYGIRRGRAYDGKVDAAKGTFRIEDLPDDQYDLAVLTDTGIYVGLSDVSATKENPRPLESGDQKALDTMVKKFDDFFDDISVIALKGDRDAAKALVHQRRKKPIYDQQSLGNKELNRMDIWNFHLRQTEWAIESSQRANLFRYEEVKDAKPREVRFVSKLGALAVRAETKTVDVSSKDVDEKK